MWCILGLEPNLQMQYGITPISDVLPITPRYKDKLHTANIYQHKANINSKNLLLHQEQEHPSISQTS